MKYTAFKRLIVEIIPESTMSAGGIDTSAAQKGGLYARGKVLSGFFLREGEVPSDKAEKDGNSFIEAGDTILFSKAAPNMNGQIFFCEETHVLAIVEN